jgi:hypothetical protein
MTVLDSIIRVNKIRENIKNEEENGMPSLPCINCISLPVCLSLAKEHNVEYFPEDKDSIIMTTNTFLFLSRIREKCSTIDNYVADHNFIYYARADLLLKYFCGEE